MGDRKTYSMRVRPDIIKSLRMLAVEKEVTMSQLIEEAIQDLLKKEKAGIKTKAKK